MSEEQKPISAVILDAHERRITRLEEDMGGIGKTIVKIEKDVEINNSLTSEIGRDTREIRDLVKGAKAFGKLAAWGASAVGLLIAFYTLGWIPR